jgi:PAS domain S-box-containing protein
VLQELQIDADHHAAVDLGSLGDRTFDLVIHFSDAPGGGARRPTGELHLEDLSESDKRPLLVGDPMYLSWQIPDPAAGGSGGSELERFRRTRDLIQEHVRALVQLGFLDALAQQRQHTTRYLDALEEGVIAHDEFRSITMFNKAAEKITGYSRDEALGMNCHELFKPDGLCGSRCSFADGPAKAPPRREYEMGFVTKDGEDRRLKMLVRPMEMGAGRVRGVVAVVRDVTEVSELRWRVRRRQGFHNIVGGSPAMQEIFETVRQVSTSDYPVLISGESGTGKELVARAIHAESRRAKGPFVPINCGALPENILESELFGHVRGAFTGAIRDKKGRFELAHKGTLFLDEVGELTQPFQVKLLRVLQEMRFELVGGERSVSVDVRIISATNQDLRQMVQQGSFREDLFYRLCVVPIGMPALRERTQDLPGLVEHFLDGIRQDTGKPIRRVSDEAMDCLLRHRWPGNVRELINALQFAAVRCEGEEILVRHLPPEVRQEEGGLQVRRPEPATPPVQTAPRKRYKLDRESVTRALEEAGGNKVLAAKLLGVGRATLYRFLNREKMN